MNLIIFKEQAVVFLVLFYTFLIRYTIWLNLTFGLKMIFHRYAALLRVYLVVGNTPPMTANTELKQFEFP